MGTAEVRANLPGLRLMFLLPDYVEAVDMRIEGDTLVLVVESDAIPDEVVELAPVYHDEAPLVGRRAHSIERVRFIEA